MAVDPKHADKERIRSLLFKVGDVRKKVVGNMRGLVSLLQEDMADHRETILSSFIECAKYLPTKPGIVGTALGLFNQNHRVFVADVINALGQELDSALVRKDHSVCICLVRVFVECANSGCLSIDEVVSFLKSVVSTSVAAGYKEGTFGMFAGLSAIPYISPDLALTNSNVTAFVKAALSDAESLITYSYQQRRNIVGSIPDIPDELEQLIACIKDLQSSGWKSEVLLRPYTMDGLREQLSAASGHIHTLPGSMARLSADFAKQPSFVPSCLPRVTSHGADTWLLRDIMRLTCFLFKDSVGECAKALLRVPVEEPYFEEVLAEALIDLSVHAPTVNSIPRLFYTSTLQRCIVLQESLRGPTETVIFALLIRQLKPETQVMLGETVSFLINSNVKFDLERIYSVNPEVFAICMECLSRIMFANAIQAKVPESLHGHVLNEPSTTGNPFPEDQEYTMVKQVVRIKDGSAVEVTQVLNQLDEGKRGTLLARAIVENGARTVTHFVRLVELYRGLCLSLVPKNVMAATLFEFWGTINPQRIERYIEICLREELVDEVSVVNYTDIKEDSLSSYRVIDMVCRSILRNSKLISAQDEAMTVILGKSDQAMTNWVVKNYFMQMEARETKGSVLDLFR